MPFLRKQYVVLLLLAAVNFITFAQQLDNAIPSIKMKLKTPKYLQSGDSIAIVAPAGILKDKEELIHQAKQLAEQWGLKVIVGKHVFNQHHHFAGSDQERTNDFQAALDNPNIKAIWAARGGYGSVRIIDRLDFKVFKQSPKWIIGYSDITALHSHVSNLGVESIHAIMGTSMLFDAEEAAKSKETLRKVLFGEELHYEIPSSAYNITGNAKGQLVGGNLSILASMLGSESQLDTKNKILFIEEIGEYKYAIDRMLQSLKRAGYFEHLQGLVIGDISNIKVNTTQWGSPIEQLILDATSDYNFPIVFGFPAGHEPDNRALIMGRTVELNVTKTVSKVFFE